MKSKKLIVAGLGHMGRNAWLKLVEKTEGVEAAALVEPNEATLKDLIAEGRAKEEHCYTTFSEAVKNEKADGVIVVTPPEMHEEVSVQAAKAGLHILCEKPMAHTLESAGRMVEAAEKAGVLLMVAQNRRHNPFIHTMRKLIREGEYGRPGQAYVTFRQTFTRDSFRDTMENPLLVDMANHHFDTIRAVLGEDADQVLCTGWNPYWSRFKGTASAVAVFEYKSGMRVVYEGSWHTINVGMTSNGCDWRIECENGVIACKDDIVAWGVRGDYPMGGPGGILEPVDMVRLEHEGGAYLLDEFLQAIEKGKAPETSGRDNLKTLTMVFGAVESLKAGKPVKIGYAEGGVSSCKKEADCTI